jgi:hypothetical protein
MREAERGADGRSLVGVSRRRHEIALRFTIFVRNGFFLIQIKKN